MNDFSLKDPIFFLQGPVEESKYEDETPCNYCSKSGKKKDKKVW